jgi:UDP-N-acetylglucosamine--N-acetylmuramyl-(pentapeptide) pyrophosphoryl-undecaprenol N-acetylglucosamine transferase
MQRWGRRARKLFRACSATSDSNDGHEGKTERNVVYFESLRLRSTRSIMNSPRTYIFAGGGTGGHLFPGIAVAQELLQREADARVLFVGSDRELEQSILVRSGIEHRSLPVESLSMLKRRPFYFLKRNWRAIRTARRLIRELRPCAVIGLGGYASAPIVWAAARARIPIVLLEQNVIPGRTTRWLARSADLVCASFPDLQRPLPSATRVEVTGNPLRQEIAKLHGLSHGSNAGSQSELLVLGGSQGADSLNDAVTAAIGLLREELSTWRIVHQTGPRQVDAVRTVYATNSIDATVESFFDDMATRYRAASVVIARAGATTLAELTCCGLPMVLLPYPHAADDHQRANAESMAVHGAAVIVEHQRTAAETATELADQLRPLLRDDQLRASMGDAARKLARPEAATAVADLIQSLAGGHSPGDA